mmetsp:Transcript_14184/g.24933  ORF Transcript_14184/g.24933 Transcript_14184/m.24933 type:complete len:207 (+) Transcript_14184:2745-3365(+)
MYFPIIFSSSSNFMSTPFTVAPPRPPPGPASVSATVLSPPSARSILRSTASCILPTPPAITGSSPRIANAATKLCPLASASIANPPTSYPSKCILLNNFSNELGTSRSAAVPTAPTFGGNPYSMMETFRSSTGVFLSDIQPCSRLHNFRTRSGMSAIRSPTNPPNTTVSMAPSSSGSEYNTTDCSPITPLDFHRGMDWRRRGEAMM